MTGPANPEYRDAYTAGELACRVGEGVAANPHRARVHYLADPPGPRQTALARMWLAGWQHQAEVTRREHRPQ
jgi:hypothetical protein